MRKRTLPILAVCLLLAATVFAQGRKAKPAPTPEKAAAAFPSGPVLDAILLKGLSARSIGPAIMGGRVADIALDPAHPFTYYVALGTGGLMKSSNNGATFEAVFADQGVASIGAVAVAPSDSKVIWVGTGEANDRNSSSWGNGVYRSSDGGSSWTHVGLEDSKVIARIVVHPTDPNTAWVAAVGNLWQPSSQRGLYKTTDGGQTWKLVLSALSAPAPYNDRVGCGDVAIDPTNPDVLYAALYARQRTPWSFVSGPELTDGQDLGGIFKSTDGGQTWRKLEKGLPGQAGRIGLAVYPKNLQIVYAVVQSYVGGTGDIRDVRSKMGGVFRSENGGESWTRTSPLDPRPFYFSQIRVDPTNDQRVYVLGFALHVSEDGGRTFREDLMQKVHPDLHALVIDPHDPLRLLLGTDGGFYQSFDGGKAWEHVNRFAGGEFYRINLDMSTPYRICGGLQDNENWVGPSRTNSKEGIVNHDWVNIGGGDGFYCVFDPTDPDIVYTESQRGYVHRISLKNGEIKVLRPEAAEGQPEFRFHWNAPLIGSTHNPGVLYLAGNHVFRFTDRGERWEVISPDLSTQELSKMITSGSGAENYGVVYALAESPVAAGLLWAGTDDGKLWVTHDDGQHWTDLSGNLPAAKGEWISRIEPGAHDANVAYVSIDAYRSGDYAPRLFRTADGGQTWQNIASNLPTDSPVKVIREDPENPNLLFAGTEFGLFLSFDRGGHWAKYDVLPTVAVDDIKIQPREHDLVIATHGRSLYIVDDIRPLEGMTTEVQQKQAFLFPPRPAFGAYLLPGFASWNGKAVYRGENPLPGALINFYVKEFAGEKVKIEITNAGKVPVAKFEEDDTPGLHRINWDLRPTENLLNSYGGEGRLFVRPGDYTLTLTYRDTKQTQTLKVDIAPGIETR